MPVSPREENFAGGFDTINPPAPMRLLAAVPDGGSKRERWARRSEIIKVDGVGGMSRMVGWKIWKAWKCRFGW